MDFAAKIHSYEGDGNKNADGESAPEKKNAAPSEPAREKKRPAGRRLKGENEENGAPQARPREKMKGMGARRRRAPFFGAAGAENFRNWGRAAGAPPKFPTPQAP